MASIQGYQPKSDFKEGGQSRWCFAEKGGHEFFIKQFLSPKYPVDTNKLSPELIAMQRKIAEEFQEKQMKFYRAVRRCRNGCVIVNQDFFRDGSFYYAVSDKVGGELLSIPQIARLPEEQKRVIFRTVMAGMAELEREHIVHSDIKADNIMVRRAWNGYCAAKIIDLESGYFEDDPPRYIVGDTPYFSPEKIVRDLDEEVDVTTKSDIFALGVLFHQYWTGEFPKYDTSEYSSTGDAILQEAPVRLSLAMPEDIGTMIAEMLSREPDDRPSASALLARLMPPEEPEHEHSYTETGREINFRTSEEGNEIVYWDRVTYQCSCGESYTEEVENHRERKHEHSFTETERKVSYRTSEEGNETVYWDQVTYRCSCGAYYTKDMENHRERKPDSGYWHVPGPDDL